MPDGASVGSITFVGTDLALLVRQTTADGDVVGIQRLDASSGALTPLVAPTPAAEWTGVTGFCDDVEPPGAVRLLRDRRMRHRRVGLPRRQARRRA